MLSYFSKQFENKEVQTIIRAYFHPYSLKQLSQHMLLERKFLGEISLKADKEEKLFNSLLEYTPFQDIQENSLRIISLPKPQTVQAISQTNETIRNCLLFDDDGISELCLELTERMRNGTKTVFTDKNTQTYLRVYPHVLKAEQVASVTSDCSTQTD